MKNPMTPHRIEPATFRFVAQRLNQCATAVPTPYKTSAKQNKIKKGTLSTSSTYTGRGVSCTP